MDTDRPAIDVKLSQKKALEDWVATFLSYWEDASMLSTKAAKIIIDEIFKVYPCLSEGVCRNTLYQMPDPESFFPDD